MSRGHLCPNMKILYALQATGNGHISRANEIIPILQTRAQVDVLLSGTQANVKLNHPIRYRKKGISFVSGKNGGMDYYASLKLLRRKQFLQELQQIQVEDYDFVINDFEPLSAWACRIKKVPCIALSHQYALLSLHTPAPKMPNPIAWLLLKYYAPCSAGLGLHFKPYNPATGTPIIRSEIRNAYKRNLGHYTVYLPAYSDKKILKVLGKIKQVQWQVFSKEARKSYAHNNCWVRPISNAEFISSISTCEGILCGAGFETPAEALYLQKKLMVIPMKGQYEQQCNAKALKQLGVPVLKKLSLKQSPKIAQWCRDFHQVGIAYPDNARQVVALIFEIYNLFHKNNPMETIREFSQPAHGSVAHSSMQV